MKRIYLSGPMTGKPAFNFPAFNMEALRLRALGYEVVNPAELNTDPATPWEQCLRADLAAMLTCDGLALMPEWMGSKGANLELHVAHRVGMEIAMAADLPALGTMCGNCDTALLAGGCDGLFKDEAQCLLNKP